MTVPRILNNTSKSSQTPLSKETSTSTSTTTKNLATNLLQQLLPQAAVPLQTAETPSKDLESVYALINTQQYEKARALLVEFLKLFEPADEHPASSAKCHIAMAHTYPDKSSDLQKHVLQAQSLLDEALRKTLTHSLPEEVKIRNCLGLRLIYRDLANSVSSDELIFAEEVANKIEQCSENIPALWDFYDRLAPIQAFPKKSHAKEVKKIIDDALQILNKDTTDFVLAIAVGYGLLAMAFPQASEECAQSSQLALEYAIDAYSKINTFTNHHGKAFVYEKFGELFSMLKSLFPANPKIKQIYTNLHALAPKSNVRKGRKVTKEPVGDPLKALKIFVILFAFAVISAVVLGRHYSKLS